MYVAFRIDRGVFYPEEYRINYQHYAVQGQRAKDLNWSTLYVVESEAEAEKIAHDLWKDTTGYVPVYNKSGYGYEWSNVAR